MPTHHACAPNAGTARAVTGSNIARLAIGTGPTGRGATAVYIGLIGIFDIVVARVLELGGTHPVGQVG